MSGMSGFRNQEIEKIKELEEENRELKEAMQWFCNRADSGEVRSKRTYEKFKELLYKYE